MGTAIESDAQLNYQMSTFSLKNKENFGNQASQVSELINWAPDFVNVFFRQKPDLENSQA